MSLKTNLVSYWKLNGNSTDSVGGNNGTDLNITYSAGNGKIKQGAGFNGLTSNILVGTGLNNAGSFSLSLWLKGGANNLYCFGKGASGDYEYDMFASSNYFGCTMRQNTDAVYMTITGGSKNIIDGNWHHCVAVYDSTVPSLKVYVDGVLDGTSTSATGSRVSGGVTPVWIGGRYDSAALWNGAVDECAYWSRVLTKLEVRQLYNGKSGLSYPFPLKGNSGLLTLKV